MPIYICEDNEDSTLADDCDDKACHVSYFPYFYANQQCAKLLDELVANDSFTDNQRKSLFDALKKCNMPFKSDYYKSPNDEYAAVPVGCYDEDHWTRRLHTCLQFNKIMSEFTAPLRGTEVKRSWVMRLPCNVDPRCLLFHGAPDLIIKGCKSEGMVCTFSEIKTMICPAVQTVDQSK